jgi:hypothetical protein
MPNDCYNKISISGDEKDIAKVKKLLSKGKRETANVFNFANIIEEPDWDKTPNEDGELPVVEKTEAFKFRKFPSSDKHDDRWYNWRVENWGTKWNSYDCDLVEEDSDSLEYVFYTAWSPPCPVIEALRNKFPEVYISAFYDEPAMELAGYY